MGTTTSRRAAAFGLLCCALVACSPATPESSGASSPRRDSGSQVGDAGGEPAAPRAPTEPSPDAKAEADAFAAALGEALGAEDAAALAALFDVEGLADAVCEGLPLSHPRMRGFREGTVKGLHTSIDWIVKSWIDGESTVKGVVVRGGVPAVRVRLVSGDGISFLDLALRSEAGKARIVDIHNHALGGGMVEDARASAAPMLAELDRGLLARLVGSPGVTGEDYKVLTRMAEHVRGGDFAAVRADYDRLPSALRDACSVVAMHLLALQRLEDDTAYAAALERAAEKVDDGAFDLMLVDLHFLRGDHDKAIACVDSFMAAVGRDAALLALQATLLRAKGDLPAARERLREALELEPTCVYAHAQGLDVLLAVCEFAAVRDSMRFLEEHAGYSFSGNLEDPVWEEFKRAPESQEWR